MTARVAKGVYLVFGAFAILYGAVALIAPAMLHSETAQSFPFAHNLREQGAANICLGLVALWASFNYERSQTIHYFLTVFTVLLSAIHWHDYFSGNLPLVSPLYNTAPFLVFALLAIARMRETE